MGSLDFFTVNVNQNFESSPALDCTPNLPPIDSTSARVTARPNGVDGL